jgi:hypothetical protein
MGALTPVSNSTNSPTQRRSVSPRSKYSILRSQPLQIKGRYRNYGEGHPLKHQIDALCIAWKTLWENFKRFFGKSPADGSVQSQKLPPYQNNADGLSTHWIGHATSLIQMDGFNILTDPIFGKLGGLYARKSKPGILPNDLPPINTIVISHTHRDHLMNPPCDNCSARVS